MTQTVPDISPLMPMHQDPLLVNVLVTERIPWYFTLTSSWSQKCKSLRVFVFFSGLCVWDRFILSFLNIDLAFCSHRTAIDTGLYTEVLVHDCSVSRALAVEILQSCTKPLISHCNHCTKKSPPSTKNSSGSYDGAYEIISYAPS